MKDAKHIHEELLIRESYSWRNGWASRVEMTMLGVLWGIALSVAFVVFVL